ncbi:hypothetical protein F5148DRAFT_1289158 [Russula earlei]|uniref:Uncharacterized protein n=1 Tax=Russula earlei TaxID=71964 RepID=A0ACC0TZI3_9AGAM|nr:hypothetical protein F5148DRAFT_1289158 [Russula earlei]
MSLTSHLSFLSLLGNPEIQVQVQDSRILVEIPRYARVPGFRYDLQCLARSGLHIPGLDVKSETSVALARQHLLRSSNLDPSQVDALIDALTREVSLIQGPPGTGKKSFTTGKEILRVLFSSKVRPIVLIAFTNHALDHMLTSILDTKNTTNVVRLGSRTTDERIAKYTLHELERVWEIEKDMTHIMNEIQLPKLRWEDVEKFLDFHYVQYAHSLSVPPFWIAKIFRWATEDENEEVDPRIYGFWKSGRDIEFLQPPPTSSKPGSNEDADHSKHSLTSWDLNKDSSNPFRTTFH